MTPNGASMETVGTNVLVLVVLLAAVLTTVSLITCVVTHYHHNHPHLQHHHHHHHHHLQSPSTEETSACSLATAQLIWNTPNFNNSSNLRNSSKFNATTVPMLALEASMERERCALHDRQVRLHSVHTDLGLDLPTSIHLPDGEEIPYGSSNRLHIRDAEQESEIYRKCIRPPPNRTIEQSDTILPYRSSSTGLLSLSSSSSNNSSNEWGQNVVRCHSMSSRYTAAVNVPSVILPTTATNARHYHHHHQQQQQQNHYNNHNNHNKVSAGLAKITMVPCLTDQRSSPTTVGGGGGDSSSAAVTAVAEVPCTAADTTSSKSLLSSSSTSSCSTSSSSSCSSGGSSNGTTSSTVSRLSTTTSLTIAPTSFVRQH